jgi:signal transduction histidine kinase
MHRFEEVSNTFFLAQPPDESKHEIGFAESQRGAPIASNLLLISLRHRRDGINDDLDSRGIEASAPEPVGWIEARSSRLHGVAVPASVVPALIDEVPALAAAATQAEGAFTITGAAELRVKESDRIAALAAGLAALGAKIEERPDGFVIEGGRPLTGAVVDSQGDHRIAMALAVAALCADGETRPYIFRMQAAQIHGQDRLPAGAVAVFSDITDVRNAERSKTSFIDAAAHDLRNPAGVFLHRQAEDATQLSQSHPPSLQESIARALQGMPTVDEEFHQYKAARHPVASGSAG